jgi:hypothetical protein
MTAVPDLPIQPPVSTGPPTCLGTAQTYAGQVSGETFGFDATGMGDVNGDGVIDFLLTSAWSAINGARSGRMFIVSERAH